MLTVEFIKQKKESVKLKTGYLKYTVGGEKRMKRIGDV